MLFNSYEFLFLFLPLSLLAYFGCGRLGRIGAAIAALVVASLLFYAWWNPVYLLLLLASIAFNYLVGRRLGATRAGDVADKPLLAFGIAANLALLAYYKYFGFAVASANFLFAGQWPVPEIVLPLGISFFTFTQIAYLVDAYRKEVREYRRLHYLLFVTFFPHLIAGPVLHHAEIMPQFADRRIFRFSAENFAVGLSIFVIGLFKKVMLADKVAIHASPVFAAAAAGDPLPAFAAWGGALAYTFQIYFDFSGYSDMAIGLARMFGVVFPANFNSPYRAGSIIEFWRRWHMTLSRFLRDYLYIPLGGGRGSRWQRYRNLWLTMLLGGLWHGAGWTFVIWGALHGIFLAINHFWRECFPQAAAGRWRRVAGVVVTFVCVVIAWVFFRADSLATAGHLLASMAGAYGLTGGYFKGDGAAMLLLCALIVWGLPNVQQIMAGHRPVLEIYSVAASVRRFVWQGNWRWAVLLAAMWVVALLNMSEISEFLYFQF